MGWNLITPAVTPMLSVGTSSQRPASPPMGWRFYESDTGRSLVWQGSQWMKVGGPTELIVDGQVAVQGANQNVVAGANSFSLATGTFTLPTGLEGPIKISTVGHWSSSANVAGYAWVLIDGNPTPRTRWLNASTGFGVYRPVEVNADSYASGTGTHTWDIRVSSDSASTAITTHVQHRINITF